MVENLCRNIANIPLLFLEQYIACTCSGHEFLYCTCKENKPKSVYVRRSISMIIIFYSSKLFLLLFLIRSIGIIGQPVFDLLAVGHQIYNKDREIISVTLKCVDVLSHILFKKIDNFN